MEHLTLEYLSNVYSHPRTNTVIATRELLDTHIISEIRNLLPENERYALKYVTICLEDGVSGQVDRECFTNILEMFGQIRDSGVNPQDILRELKNRTDELAPVVKARPLVTVTPDVKPEETFLRSLIKPKKARPVAANGARGHAKTRKQAVAARPLRRKK